MKKLSVSEIIYEYLKERAGEYHAGYEFCNKTVTVGNYTYWLGSSADRKARQLAIDGKIERVRKGKYAFYRVKPKEPTQLKLSTASLQSYSHKL